MLSKLGEKKSVEECVGMINHFDLNGDGVLSFEEFKLFDEKGILIVMGSCVSVEKSPKPAIRSKRVKLVIPPRVREEPINTKRPTAEVSSKSQRSVAHPSTIDSKEDNFFESQNWIGSDCEEDFFSVNGDSVSSVASPPSHLGCFASSPHVNGTLSTEKTPDSKQEPSSNEGKRDLVDLLHTTLPTYKEIRLVEFLDEDKFWRNKVVSDHIPPSSEHAAKGKFNSRPFSFDPPPEVANETPYVGREKISKADTIVEKKKTVMATQTFIPKLGPSSSFRETRNGWSL
ncbi:hypothetical protein L1049_028575 [Liquidambar formosana]|uniref:EF-hand domain-containing protein n=1 Tax=Liquidambar formosana TaxID=63359 RepID=A0AAP0WWS5_LIQFO